MENLPVTSQQGAQSAEEALKILEDKPGGNGHTKQVTTPQWMYCLLVPVVAVLAVQAAPGCYVVPTQPTTVDEDSQAIRESIATWGGPMPEDVLRTAFFYALHLNGRLQQGARGRYLAAKEHCELHYFSTVGWDRDRKDPQKRVRYYLKGQGHRAVTRSDQERVMARAIDAFEQMGGIPVEVAGSFYKMTLLLCRVLEGETGYCVYMCIQKLELEGFIRKREYEVIEDGKRNTMSVYFYSRHAFMKEELANSPDMQALRDCVWRFFAARWQPVRLSQLCKDAYGSDGQQGLKLDLDKLHSLGYANRLGLVEALGYKTRYGVLEDDVVSFSEDGKNEWHVLPPQGAGRWWR